MKFCIRTMLWAFALLASAFATFGPSGVIAAGTVVGFRCFVASSQGRAVPVLLAHITILVLSAILLPALGDAGGSARRNSCERNMQQLALAILAYESEHGTLPPAYTTDDEGNALHSWRVLILPYLYEQALFDAVQLNEPWDSPSNRKLWDRMPAAYRCPGCEHAHKMGTYSHQSNTPNYFAVVDESTLWPGNSSVKTSDISGKASCWDDCGTESTVLLLEGVKPGICWMEPVDHSFQEALSVMMGKQSGHLSTSEAFFTATTASKSYAVAFADASTRSRSYPTKNDREKYESEYREAYDRDYDLVIRDGAEFQLKRTGTGIIELSTSEEAPAIDLLTTQVYLWKRIYAYTFFVLVSLLPLRNAKALRPSLSD